MRAVLDAQGLCDGYLDVVDVFLVPKGLEDGVAKAHHHEILHQLLRKVMVYTKDLALIKDPSNRLVEGCRGFKVRAKRLLEDYPCKSSALGLLGDRGVFHVLNNDPEQFRRDGKIEYPIDGRAAFPRDVLQKSLKRRVFLLLREIEGDVGDPAKEPLEQVIFHLEARELHDRDLRILSEFLAAFLLSRDAHDVEILIQPSMGLEEIERRKKLSLGEVSCRSEDGEYGGICHEVTSSSPRARRTRCA